MLKNMFKVAALALLLGTPVAHAVVQVIPVDDYTNLSGLGFAGEVCLAKANANNVVEFSCGFSPSQVGTVAGDSGNLTAATFTTGNGEVQTFDSVSRPYAEKAIIAVE